MLCSVACDEFESSIIPFQRYHKTMNVIANLDQLKVILWDTSFLRGAVKECLGLLKESWLEFRPRNPDG